MHRAGSVHGNAVPEARGLGQPGHTDSARRYLSCLPAFPSRPLTVMAWLRAAVCRTGPHCAQTVPEADISQARSSSSNGNRSGGCRDAVFRGKTLEFGSGDGRCTSFKHPEEGFERPRYFPSTDGMALSVYLATKLGSYLILYTLLSSVFVFFCPR